MQGPRSHSISHTLGSKVASVALATVDFVVLVTAHGRVQSLVARGAREAGLVPRLEGRLDLFRKVDSLPALGTHVATSPPWLGTCCRSWGRSCRSGCFNYDVLLVS